jgi:hypothetical protein
MSKPQVAPGAAQALVELRRARILSAIGARPAPPSAGVYTTPPDRLAFFRREAEELYWNELSWEQMTEEESIQGGHLTELVFPGLLALVDGLLPDRTSAASAEGPRSYPDAVEEILTFLGAEGAALTAELRAGADSQKVIWARAMTLRLIDLVLYRLYRLTAEDQELIESAEDE